MPATPPEESRDTSHATDKKKNLVVLNFFGFSVFVEFHPFLVKFFGCGIIPA